MIGITESERYRLSEKDRKGLAAAGWNPDRLETEHAERALERRVGKRVAREMLRKGIYNAPDRLMLRARHGIYVPLRVQT